MCLLVLGAEGDEHKSYRALLLFPPFGPRTGTTAELDVYDSVISSAALSMTAETPPGSVSDNAPARAIAVCGAMKRVFPLRGVVGGWVRFSFPLTTRPHPLH